MRNQGTILYAYHNNELISIYDACKGKKYLCPACNEELIIRAGPTRQKHFAHKSNSDCKTGYQTVLHLLAKEILEETKEFYVPGIYMDLPPYCFGKKNLIPPKRVPITSVVAEKRVDDIIPDIIMKAGNKELFVEIYVTHPVDEVKKQKIIDLKTSAIEIDLHNVERLIDKEELKTILIDSVRLKTWIYCEPHERIIKKIKENTQKKKIRSGQWSEIVENCDKNKILYYDKNYCTLADCEKCDCFLGLEVTNEGNYLLCDSKDFLQIDESKVVKKYKPKRNVKPTKDLSISKMSDFLNVSFNVPTSQEFRNQVKQNSTMFWDKKDIYGFGNTFKDFILVCCCKDELEFNAIMDFLECYFNDYKVTSLYNDNKNFVLLNGWVKNRENRIKALQKNIN